jgi:D-tyrosyl-tRNA(Tyr) deacylase
LLGLIQRVSEAKVVVAGETIGEIGSGLLLLLGVQKGDTQVNVPKMVHKVYHYRVFPDEKGHMNLSLKDTGGGLLIVPQFTIAADTKKGLRPSFSSAADPELANKLFSAFVSEAAEITAVQTGIFGADMKVSLVNDGPVTFMLNT